MFANYNKQMTKIKKEIEENLLMLEKNSEEARKNSLWRER